MTSLSRKLVWGSLAAGVAAAGIAVAQPPTPKEKELPAKAAADPAAPDVVRAADPFGAMLSEAKTAYSKVRDYGCTFTRQERINGALSAEQVAEMKVRATPHAVHVKFAKPDGVAGMELCYAANLRLGKLRYRPAGAKGINGFTSTTLDDPKVLAENRHPVNELGIGGVIDLLTSIAGREKVLNNPVEVFTGDYQFAGKTTVRYELFTRRPHAHRYAYRMLVYVDKESKLPVRFEAYDQPKPGLSVGDLLEAYSFSDLKLNVGLGDSAFDY